MIFIQQLKFLQMIEYIIDLVLQALKFYIPLFYTFRFLQDQDHQNLERVLKFWTINSFFYIIGGILSLIMSQSLFPLLVIIFFGILNYEHFYYSQKIYELTIQPLFEQNKQTIQKYAAKIEKVMNDESKKLTKGVQDSFQTKAKRVAGTILMNAMNPNAGQKQQQQQQNKQE